MRLSRIWRILQIKESVIHSGRRPRWITPSKICRILHILREPNSIIALLFNKFLFPVLKGVSPFRSLFFCSQKIRQSSTLFFLVNGSVIYSGAHFWRHFDVIGSIICSGLHFWRDWFNMTKILSNFGEEQLIMVNYGCGFHQSETGKYFKWMVMVNKNISIIQRSIYAKLRAGHLL